MASRMGLAGLILRRLPPVAPKTCTCTPPNQTRVSGDYLTINTSADTVGVSGSGTSTLTVNKTGQFVVSFRTNAAGGAGTSISLELEVNAVQVDVMANQSDTNPLRRVYWAGPVTAGQTVRVKVTGVGWGAGMAFSGMSGEIRFTPTRVRPQ